MSDYPIEGQIVLLAGARASVSLDRLPGLLERAQAYVRERRDEYTRSYERIEGARGCDYLCVDDGHWERIGTELGFDDRESDAVRRAHVDQFTRDGRRQGREDEFESTLEIREVVAVPATY